MSRTSRVRGLRGEEAVEDVGAVMEVLESVTDMPSASRYGKGRHIGHALRPASADRLMRPYDFSNTQVVGPSPDPIRVKLGRHCQWWSVGSV